MRWQTTCTTVALVAACAMSWMGSAGSAHADPVPSAPSIGQGELVRRSSPSSESASETADRARHGLQGQLSGSALGSPVALPIPDSWTGAPECEGLKTLVVRLLWSTENGQDTEEPWTLRRPSPSGCLPAADWERLARDTLSAARGEGWIVTRLTMQPLDPQGQAVMILRLLSLKAIHWPDGGTQGSRYGWAVPLGRPLRLFDLDDLIERVGRLRSNDIHVVVNPDAELHAATVVVRNESRRTLTGDSSVLVRRALWSVSGGVAAENPLDMGDRWSLSLQRSGVPGGSVSSLNLGAEWLVFGGVAKVSTSRSLTVVPGDASGSIPLSTTQNEWQVSFSRTLYRDAHTVWSWSPQWDTKRIAADFEGARVQSLSPRVSIIEIGTTLQRLWDSRAVLVANSRLRHGFQCCGATIDNRVGALDSSAAHAQFNSVQASAVLSQPWIWRERQWQWLSVAQAFHSSRGLYPTEDFSLASPSAVDGVFKAQALVDTGWSLRTGTGTGWAWPADGWHLQTTASLAYAKGKRYFDGVHRHLFGISLDGALEYRTARISLMAFLPGHGQDLESEHPSLQLGMSIVW